MTALYNSTTICSGGSKPSLAASTAMLTCRLQSRIHLSRQAVTVLTSSRNVFEYPKLPFKNAVSSHDAAAQFRGRTARAGGRVEQHGDYRMRKSHAFSQIAKHQDRSEVLHKFERMRFIPWLHQHVKTLSLKSSDRAFSTFLENLLPIIRSELIWRSMSDDKTLTSLIPDWSPSKESKPIALIKTLRTACIAHGPLGVDTQLKYSYNGLLARPIMSQTQLDTQTKIADLRFPAEWFPMAREIQRNIHLHVGPTNSGKTYHALKELEKAGSGVYAGPLRLLAHEVYTRLNAQGRLCDLVTGDEQVYQAGGAVSMRSCTVEMAPLNVDIDVAVIDEIQMIGDRERGWAWTQALLGLRAKELHLCGEQRSVPLIRKLIASTGDKLMVHTYERLSPLKMMSRSLRGELKNLRKGDCVIVLSRLGIHEMKTQIEKATQRRVAIVYGGLPPDVRAHQARLFNDPANDYDILVATDAIGMGLNLAIKRIIFETVTKFNGLSFETLETSQIKQIAGRAGRFRTAHEAQDISGKSKTTATDLPDRPATNLGLITTLEEQELPLVRKAIHDEADPILTAGLSPPDHILIRFAAYFAPSTRFSFLLLRLHELSSIHPRYHLCDLKDKIDIADKIQTVPGLTNNDRVIFCKSPASPSDDGMAEILVAFAKCVGDHTSGELLSIPELPLDVLDEDSEFDKQYMGKLEFLHKAVVLYLWLSYRFAGVFISQDMAFHVKKLVEDKIHSGLVEYSSSPQIQKQIAELKAKALRQIQEMHVEVPQGDNASMTRSTSMQHLPHSKQTSMPVVMA